MPAVLLVLVSVLSQQLGASIAGLLFPQVGAAGMVALRLTFSALVLLAVTRPAWRTLAGLGWRGWGAVVGLGTAMTGMNLMIYEAFDRIPQGVAVTFEVLGPLALSVLARRAWDSLGCALLALAGIVLLGRDGFGGGTGLDPVGVALALGAAACWAGYILMTRAAGSVLPGVGGLALATVVGTVVALPIGAARAGDALLEPWVLATGLAVALLSTALPYGVEMHVLRRMPTSLFSLITCLSPVAAALTAWAVRGQELEVWDLAGMALVVVACAAAVAVGARRGEPVPATSEIAVVAEEGRPSPSD